MKYGNQPPRVLDRRAFLAAGVGVSVGLVSPGLVQANLGSQGRSICAHANSEKFLTVLRYPHLLGHPSSREAVENGLFPIPAERVIILKPPDFPRAIGCAGPADREPLLYLPNQHSGRGGKDRDRSERIATILATYYGLPEHQKNWAELIAMHDPLEPPVSCEGVFLSDLHDYVSSPLIHWWVFVSGEASRGRGQQPHITLVQASSRLDSRGAGLAGLYLAHMIFRIHGNPKKWGWIASMDHLGVTRFVNDQMVKALRGLPPGKNDGA